MKFSNRSIFGGVFLAATFIVNGLAGDSAFAAGTCAPEFFSGAGNVLTANETRPSIDVAAHTQLQMDGNVVLIDLWANWCGPCVAGLPEMREQQGKFRDRGFRVIGATDTRFGDARTQALIKKHELNYDTISQSGLLDSIQTELKMENYIPQVLLVDRNGEIQFQGHPSRIPAGLIEKLVSRPVDAAKKAACDASRVIRPLETEKPKQSGDVIHAEGADSAKAAAPAAAPASKPSTTGGASSTSSHSAE